MTDVGRLENKENENVPLGTMSRIMVQAVACEVSRNTNDANVPRAAMNQVDAIKSKSAAATPTGCSEPVNNPAVQSISTRRIPPRAFHAAPAIFARSISGPSSGVASKLSHVDRARSD